MESIKTVREDGTIQYRNEKGLKHRTDGPAVIRTKENWTFMEPSCGTQADGWNCCGYYRKEVTLPKFEYWENGKKISVEYTKKTQDKFDRRKAMEKAAKQKIEEQEAYEKTLWTYNEKGLSHNEEGPAFEGTKDKPAQYWLNGRKVTKDKHARYIKIKNETGATWNEMNLKPQGDNTGFGIDKLENMIDCGVSKDMWKVISFLPMSTVKKFSSAGIPVEKWIELV